MTSWGSSNYGDPCRECGYDGAITLAETLALIADLPRRFGDLLNGQDATVRHPELTWSAAAYVSHVADDLRIFAKRFAGQALGATGPVSACDQDLLADAGNYSLVLVEDALWSMEHAVRDRREAVGMATAKNVTQDHSERGALSVLDAMRINTHDAHHHLWDVQQTVASAKI
jgi:hypothetical protein